MSGHSKWSQIKRQKAVTDKKKGTLFTKLGNIITIAAKQGGGDPSMNFKLRLAVEKAKSANMPNENIERAIKKGAGGQDGLTLEEVVYEGFGPGGAAIIIEATTDNKNRITSELRNIFSKHHGNLGNSGSVSYLFGQKGVLRLAKNKVTNKEEFELKLIDLGADDIIEEEEGFTVFSAPNQLAALKEYLEKSVAVPESADIELVPITKVNLTDPHDIEKINELLGELENVDDITNFYTNADF